MTKCTKCKYFHSDLNTSLDPSFKQFAHLDRGVQHGQRLRNGKLYNNNNLTNSGYSRLCTDDNRGGRVNDWWVFLVVGRVRAVGYSNRCFTSHIVSQSHFDQVLFDKFFILNWISTNDVTTMIRIRIKRKHFLLCFRRFCFPSTQTWCDGNRFCKKVHKRNDVSRHVYIINDEIILKW